GNVPAEVEASFAGLCLRFAPLKAQKTGLFLDQAHNLALFDGLVRTLVPANGTLLDICCYAGAWSAAGARAGLASFTLVDQDATALARAAENVVRNQATARHAPGETCQVETRHGDMFELLSLLGKEGKSFDVVVADPPAFAKAKKHVPEARRAYARMVKLASRLVRPGGLLVVCSCSRNLEESEFLDIVGTQLASTPEGWTLVLRGAQAPDHTVPAGETLAHYLKCAFYAKGGEL
ncbi:MAG: methyltransferase, partial [Silvanigrellales bacterium]|nr:methyltransferase [Silvanigrellales bacterium]